MRKNNKKKILFVEDDLYYQSTLACQLIDAGFDIELANSIDEALLSLDDCIPDICIVDSMMDPGEFNEIESCGGTRTGIILAREIRDQFPDIPIIGISNSPLQDIMDWFNRPEESLFFFQKPVSPQRVIRTINAVLNCGSSYPQIFIVHGRSEVLLYELIHVLENDLGLPRPKTLQSLPSKGLTIIESFEMHAQDADLVFVLMAPDDYGSLKEEDNLNPRSRMNVIFELGYFYGLMKRTSGKIIVLKYGIQEFPSDISGILYLDISKGIRSSVLEIKREIYNNFPFISLK